MECNERSQRVRTCERVRTAHSRSQEAIVESKSGEQKWANEFLTETARRITLLPQPKLVYLRVGELGSGEASRIALELGESLAQRSATRGTVLPVARCPFPVSQADQPPIAPSVVPTHPRLYVALAAFHRSQIYFVPAPPVRRQLHRTLV
jgi:hypothetical protein